MALDDLKSNKQQAFVVEYIKDSNAAAAARRAGYAPEYADRQGYQLLENPRVAAEIERLKRERNGLAMVDAEWLLRELVLQYQKATDGDRDAAALKALDLIGKHCDVGAFKDRLEISGGMHLSHEAALRELE